MQGKEQEIVNDQLAYFSQSCQTWSSRTGSRSEFNRRASWTETAEPSDLDLRVEGPSCHANGDQGHGLRVLLVSMLGWWWSNKMGLTFLLPQWAHHPLRWAACGRGQPAQSKGPCAESPQLAGRTRVAWGCHPKQHSTEDDETCFSTRMQLNLRIVSILFLFKPITVWPDAQDLSLSFETHSETSWFPQEVCGVRQRFHRDPKSASQHWI